MKAKDEGEEFSSFILPEGVAGSCEADLKELLVACAPKLRQASSRRACVRM